MSANETSSSTETSKTSEKIKRPLNAFILWSKKRRRVIANENPQMHNFDISRKLGLEWQKLSEEEKSKYFEEAKRLKEEHKQLYPDYKYQPRKRDKTNKRNKLLHGPPYQFSFYPHDAAGFFDTRYHYTVADARPSFHAESLLPHPESSGGNEDISHSAHAKPTHTEHNPHSVIYQSFRQNYDGFVPYRGLDAPYIPLRPNFDFSHLNWYSPPSAPGRVGPVSYCSRMYPWHATRQGDFHSWVLSICNLQLTNRAHSPRYSKGIRSLIIRNEGYLCYVVRFFTGLELVKRLFKVFCKVRVAYSLSRDTKPKFFE